MKVDFNNVRLQAVNAYKELVEVLNKNISEDHNGMNIVQIDISELQKPLDDLRTMLATIACTYDKLNEEFKDLTDEIGELSIFNSGE